MIRGGTPDEKFLKMPNPLRRARFATACNGKATYSSAAVAVRIARRDRKRKGAMGVYRCAPCGGYHIGHGDPSAPKTIRK